MFSIPPIKRPFDIQVTLPGSKSIALRQLAMCALCEGTSEIIGVPECDDTAAMLDCLRALGLEIHVEAERTIVRGPMNYTRDVHLDARMSGASTRLLIGLAALRSGRTVIDGHASLRTRTNQPMLDVLAANGCEIQTDNGGLPTTIAGPIDPGETLTVDGSISSQYLTGLLIASPAMRTRPKMRIAGELVSRPYVEITRNEMAKRGVSVAWQNDDVLLAPEGHYANGTASVEGDATAATYFAALATLHKSSVTLTNLGEHTRQGDYAFLELMEALGAEVVRSADSTRITGPTELKPLRHVDMTTMPDAALTLIAMGPLLPGGIEITGLSSLHHKECDRLECPADELRKLGATLATTHDSIRIEPICAQAFRGGELTTYHDHRMAMAFSTLASVTGHIDVDDERVVDKTYPGYWDAYALTLASA